MQTNYNVRYLQIFYDNLDEILHYIKYQLKNPQAAQNLLNSIEQAIIKRISNPEYYGILLFTIKKEHVLIIRSM